MNLAITVIIPLYNGKRFILQAVESVIKQSLPPVELIIVDDGSSDGSVSAVEAVIASTPFPIQIVSKENGGQSAARNYAALMAKGDFLAFLDQDDVWYPNHLEELIKPFMAASRMGWVYSNLDEIAEDGLIVAMGIHEYLPGKHPKTTLLEAVATDMFILPSATIVRKEAFDQVGGYDERLSGYEDDDLFFRLFRHGWKHAYITDALSQWRIYSTSSSHSFRMLQSRRIYYQKLMDAFPESEQFIHYPVREGIASRFFGTSLGEYLKGQKAHDWKGCHQAYTDMLTYCQGLHLKRSMRIKLQMMRMPALYHTFYRLRH